MTCSLEEIFGSAEGRGGRYNKRSSSAHWERDELTSTEKSSYRAQMGYGEGEGSFVALKKADFVSH